eukprot:759190-Hanusia_phi.AAC.3
MSTVGVQGEDYGVGYSRRGWDKKDQYIGSRIFRNSGGTGCILPRLIYLKGVPGGFGRPIEGRSGLGIGPLVEFYIVQGVGVQCVDLETFRSGGSSTLYQGWSCFTDMVIVRRIMYPYFDLQFEG